jgi:hypothetical protein
MEEFDTVLREHLGTFVLRHSFEDCVNHLARVREARDVMGKVAFPHHMVDPNVVSAFDAEGVVCEPPPDVLLDDLAGEPV